MFRELEARDLFMALNLVAVEHRLSYPRKNPPPIGFPYPPSPSLKKVSFDGGQLHVAWQDPDTSLFSQYVQVMACLFVRVIKKGWGETFLLSAFPIPSLGQADFEFLPVNDWIRHDLRRHVPQLPARQKTADTLRRATFISCLDLYRVSQRDEYPYTIVLQMDAAAALSESYAPLPSRPSNPLIVTL